MRIFKHVILHFVLRESINHVILNNLINNIQDGYYFLINSIKMTPSSCLLFLVVTRMACAILSIFKRIFRGCNFIVKYGNDDLNGKRYNTHGNHHQILRKWRHVTGINQNRIMYLNQGCSRHECAEGY